MTTRSLRGGVVAIGLMLSVAACATSSPESPSAPAPTTGGAAFELERTPPNVGCDSMAPSYRTANFHIDPAAAEPVTATTETGATLRTLWSDTFTGDASAKVVRDPAGMVVVADGEILIIPNGDWPRLNGYFVCPSTDALYILSQDPS